FRHIQATDLLDIFFCAALIFLAYQWLRRRTTPAVMVAVGIVCSLYVVVQRMEMYLTAKFFEVGLLTVCFGLFVIFQKDIRSLFERIAAWSPFQSSGCEKLARPFHQQLCQAIAELRERRVGALLV